MCVGARASVVMCICDEGKPGTMRFEVIHALEFIKAGNFVVLSYIYEMNKNLRPREFVSAGLGSETGHKTSLMSWSIKSHCNLSFHVITSEGNVSL